MPEFHVGHHVLKSVDLTDEALANADLTIIITDHGATDWERVVAKSQRVLDTRNATAARRESPREDPQALKSRRASALDFRR